MEKVELGDFVLSIHFRMLPYHPVNMISFRRWDQNETWVRLLVCGYSFRVRTSGYLLGSHYTWYMLIKPIQNMNVTTIFGPPPPGINLEDDRISQDNAVVASICVLAVITVISRFIVRIYVQGVRPEIDDWLIGASVILLIALLSATLYGTSDFDPSNRQRTLFTISNQAACLDSADMCGVPH